MTSNFARAMSSCSQTWNGAFSLSNPDITGKTTGRISLFFKGVRGLDKTRLYEYLHISANESVMDTFLLVFHIRDCRGGKGERVLGRQALVWLFLSFPDEFNKIYHLIAEYGRWDDLMELWPKVLELNDIDYLRITYGLKISSNDELIRLQTLQKKFVQCVANQLIDDYTKMINGKTISICAKWAPTQKDSYDRKYNVVRTLVKEMGITPKTYRKQFISPLREYLSVVERYMCSNRWDLISYSKVPSCAMKRLKKAFEKHSPELFCEWKKKLSEGKVEVKATQLYPHELIHEIRTKYRFDSVCEAQWKVLQEKVNKNGSLQDSLFVCDVSTSMSSWGENRPSKKSSFTPMDVAISLSLLGSNSVKGPFHNHIITFHSTPTFHVVSDSNLYTRWNTLIQQPWGGSTNLEATFDLILTKAISHGLSQKDMPKKIFIISDMQFNSVESGQHISNFERINQKYAKANYIRPNLIFWNVCGATTDFPVSVTDNGTALISGFSPSIMSVFMDGKDFSPYSILCDILDSERLVAVKQAFLY
jgi:hypothetical protein